MNYISESHRIKCHAIIHSASIAAGVTGAGLCWLPCSDTPVITATQIAMAVALGKVFGIKLSKSAAKAAIAAAAAATTGRTAAQLGIFWIPFANLVVNSATAVGLTEIVGWMLAADFAEQTSMTKAA